MLATKTMLPGVFALIIARAVAFATTNVPVTLMSMTFRNADAGNSEEGPLSDSPAQVTSPLTG